MKTTRQLYIRQNVLTGTLNLNNIPLNTLRVILETIFPANLLTGAKHSAFYIRLAVNSLHRQTMLLVGSHAATHHLEQSSLSCTHC